MVFCPCSGMNLYIWMHPKDKKRCWIFWGLSHRQFWDAMRMPGTESGLMEEQQMLLLAEHQPYIIQPYISVLK